MMINLSRLFFFFLLLIYFSSSANTVQFIGRVIDNSASARETCLNLAIKSKEATCSAETGTVITSSIKNKPIQYKGKSGQARIVTFNYK
ncbi:hypothetical protein ACRFV7_002157 [Klebsiella oxytoca]|uniref:hypothetical protein n=1 Tax=Klebsiella oxytoca TaxID=571 RepID=UPI00066D3A9E|nr:hypothetical protein [Klebsiella oxytoca]EJA2383395.1 hypothetical protein [Klebsiella oxytoca]EJZ8298206.1 hypothetical protein [Klebsiella oxytoca]EKM0800898.1 hypothetical protein [Klebsiella oxytoca]EKT7899192.1 hypothetical protein [Klebsiella oxytoca]ELI3673398.1 hypothetical protein [Klebsiella oxytoca]